VEIDDTIPVPLPIGRILRRARKIAVQPVAFRWMLGHVLLLYGLLATTSAVLEPERWEPRGIVAWSFGWWTVTALLTGTATAGVALGADPPMAASDRRGGSCGLKREVA